MRVRAVIGGLPRWQVREVSASTGYGGHDMLDAHFGLGDAAWIDTLIAEWPGGARDTVVGLPVDRVLTLQQSVGVVGVPAPPAPMPPSMWMLGAPQPNPTRGAIAWTLELAAPGTVRLDLHDVRGRHLRRLFAGELGAGRHVVPTTLPAGLPVGAYFVRGTSHGRGEIVRRVALVR